MQQHPQSPERKYGPELLEQAAGEINQEDRAASLTGMRHRILAIRDRRRQQASPASAAPTSERIVDRAGGAGRVRGADAYRRTKGGEGR